MNELNETKSINKLYKIEVFNSHVVKFYKTIKNKFNFIIFDDNEKELYKSIDYVSFDIALQDAIDTAKIYF